METINLDHYLELTDINSWEEYKERYMLALSAYNDETSTNVDRFAKLIADSYWREIYKHYERNNNKNT